MRCDVLLLFHSLHYKLTNNQQKFQVLLVSQFTLNATFKGRKPNFNASMKPDIAREMFAFAIDCARKVIYSVYSSDNFVFVFVWLNCLKGIGGYKRANGCFWRENGSGVGK